MSVRARRAVMALAGVFWAAALSLAGAGIAGRWSLPGEVRLLCAAFLAASAATFLSVTAVLGHFLAPWAAAYEIGARAAFRAAMPPPRGRHARELAEANPPAKVYHLRRRLISSA